MRRMFRLLASAAGLVLIAGACGDPVSVGDPLTDEEIAAISQLLAGSAVDGFNQGFSNPNPSAPLGAPEDLIQFSQSVSYTGTCTGGGSVDVQGSASGQIETTTQSGNLTLNVQTMIAGCQATHNAVVFTVGAEITLSGEFTFEQGAPVGENVFKYEGNFTWTSTDARSGGCQVNVTITISPTGASSVRGAVCGRDVTHVA